MKTITVYPIAALKLYALFRDSLGYDGSIDPNLFCDRVRPYLELMLGWKVLKKKGYRNYAVRRILPRDFKNQLAQIEKEA